MKSLITVLAAAFILLAGLNLAQAEGNWRKGKYLFRKNCRTCHAAGGEAKELSPVTFKQAQWQAIFDGDKFPCQDKWPQMKAGSMKDIYAHLHGHAADSPSPAKCK